MGVSENRGWTSEFKAMVLAPRPEMNQGIQGYSSLRGSLLYFQTKPCKVNFSSKLDCQYFKEDRDLGTLTMMRLARIFSICIHY